MSLEKTTFVSTASNGQLRFRQVGAHLQTGAHLEVQVVDSDNTVRDTATLSEDDLRSLLKDSFPTKRKTREAKAPGNGTSHKKGSVSAGQAI